MKYTTLKEFFGLLDQAKADYAWFVEPDGEIRGYSGGEWFCPITAVVEHENHEDYCMDWSTANTRFLCLRDTVAHAVALAADNLAINKHGIKATRNRLLGILNLKESA